VTAAPENAGGIEVLHAAVPGRLRLRVPGLRLDRAVMAELEQSLSGMPGVAFVDARPATGTLVVRHDPAVEADDIVGALARLAAAARPAVPESGPRSTRSDAVAGSDTTWHARSLEDVLAELDTSREAGLTSEDARARLERHGPNTLGEARPLRAWPMLVGQITNVPVAMLGASAATALATGGRLDAAFIGAVVALNAGIGFATEWQSCGTACAGRCIRTRSSSAICSRSPTARP
jgi:Ca2+-transporting ATPase